MKAYHIIALFLEILLQRLPLLSKTTTINADMKECCISLAFMSHRCEADLPELTTLCEQLIRHFGSECFAGCYDDTTAVDHGVNLKLCILMSLNPPSADVKHIHLKHIADEFIIPRDKLKVELPLVFPVIPTHDVCVPEKVEMM